jgi:hypothetical protein
VEPIYWGHDIKNGRTIFEEAVDKRIEKILE